MALLYLRIQVCSWVLRHGGPHKCPTHRVLWDTVQFVRLLSTGACCGALAVANYSYEAVLGMDHLPESGAAFTWQGEEYQKMWVSISQSWESIGHSFYASEWLKLKSILRVPKASSMWEPRFPLHWVTTTKSVDWWAEAGKSAGSGPWSQFFYLSKWAHPSYCLNW